MENEFNESRATAIAHLKMLEQYASGEVKPKAGDVERRFRSVLTYLLTGQCVAEESMRPAIEKLSAALAEVSTHLEPAA